MPWKVIKNDSRCTTGKPWAVVKSADNELEGCHRSKKAANQQIRALNAAVEEATWTTAFINSLPDRSFAVVAGGQRYLPHHGKITTHTSTNVDEPHLKNAAARVNQIKPASLIGRAKSHLRSHYRAKGWDLPDNLKESDHMNQLVESYSTAVHITENEKDPNIVARARFQISEIDQRNRNGRVYPREVWEAQVQRFTRGAVTGQDGHPTYFETPKVTDAFLIFDRLEIQGDRVFAEADVVNTQRGKDFVAVAKAGAKIADSTRGFGSVESVEKWEDGKPASIVQQDFRLLGVDVMFDNYQSVPGAQMQDIQAEAVHFIHEDWEKYDMTEITGEWLQENHPDVVEELTHALEHERDELKEQVDTLTVDLTEANSAIQEAEAKLDEIATKLEESAAKIVEYETELEEAKDARAISDAVSEEYQAKTQELEEQVADLTEARDRFKNKAEALAYVQERALGEPAAMLMIRELSKCESKDEVREKFARAKRDAEAMLASLPPTQGQSRYVENDNDNEQPHDLSPEAKRYGAMTGLRPIQGR